MPVYCYACKNCEANFEVRHRMSFEDQVCIECGSRDVFKIPSISIGKNKPSSSAKPGKIVDDYIRDTKREIKKEKNSLRKREL